jgi:hypothetical protein
LRWLRALFEMSRSWMVPSLICALVMRDAATAEPVVAVAIAATATTSAGLGVRNFFTRFLLP